MSCDLRSAGLTSIIIPCWGQLAFTRQCLAALKSHTRRPWELIVVDNGSTDRTPDYLAGVSDIASVPVTVITNATNRGFPAAVNQGLKAARGGYLVLLNNDVIVTDGWLEQLIGLVNARRGPLAAAGAGTCAGDGNGSAGKVPRPLSALCPVLRSPPPLAPPPGVGGLRSDRGVHPHCLLPTAHCLLFAPSASLGLCPTMPRRRNWSRTCRIAIYARCTLLPGNGATSIAGSGSRLTSCRGSACS